MRLTEKYSKIFNIDEQMYLTKTKLSIQEIT